MRKSARAIVGRIDAPCGPNRRDWIDRSNCDADGHALPPPKHKPNESEYRLMMKSAAAMHTDIDPKTRYKVRLRSLAHAGTHLHALAHVFLAVAAGKRVRAAL